MYSHSMIPAFHQGSEEQTEAMDLSTKGPTRDKAMRQAAAMSKAMNDDEVRKYSAAGKTRMEEDGGKMSILMKRSSSREEMRMAKNTSLSSSLSSSSSSIDNAGITRNISPPMFLLRRLLSDDDSDEEYKRTPSPTPLMSGQSPVELAEEGSRDVHPANMTDYFIESVSFAQSFPQFQQLSHSDQIILLQNAWGRLVLLNMAQNDAQFQVQHAVVDEHEDDVMMPFTKPTLKSARAIQMFIEKCQNIGISYQEYNFLKLLTIFNSDYAGLAQPDLIQRLNVSVQRLLEYDVVVTNRGDVMHYARLLLCLPPLYGVNTRDIENLLFRHITTHTDIDLLLKDMLQEV